MAVSLILLLVLTLIVVSGGQQVVLQEKMTAAVRDSHMALADAETGLKEAEEVIEGLVGTSGFSDTGVGGYYSLDNGPTDVFDSSVWDNTKTISAVDSVSGNPASYFIEDVDIINVSGEDIADINVMGYGQTTGEGDVNAFRVVSRAAGKSGNAERIVIGYYGKRL